MYKMDLVLRYLKCLICKKKKTQKNKQVSGIVYELFFSKCFLALLQKKDCILSLVDRVTIGNIKMTTLLKKKTIEKNECLLQWG